ncbi:restriction endonuclease [Nonomuraea sp. NPDC003201]
MPQSKSLIDGSWGDLEEWLAATTSRQRRFELVRFPNEPLREEFIASIETRTEAEVRALLRRLLPRNMNITQLKQINLMSYDLIKKEHPELLSGLKESEYWRRALNLDGYDETSWQGITWILDLLPNHPGLALQAIKAYFIAHMHHLTDDLIWALGDAEDVIRARWISNPKTDSEYLAALAAIDPRDFEYLIERLYDSMGYETELTPRSKDGGRDVIAARREVGRSERLLIEVKRYSAPVGVALVRALLGVVSNEKVNKGVLVTCSVFTRGAINLSRENSRLELISGFELVRLLNEHLGASWPTRIAQLAIASRRHHGSHE